MVYYMGDYPPEWGPLAIALAARAVEVKTGEPIVSPPEGFNTPQLQYAPLLGTLWDCEYYVDVGARSARAHKGGVEGFILKAAVLERCDRGGRLEERIKYSAIRRPGGGLIPFLPIVGGERLRQAAVYLVELGLAISLARSADGRSLIVRHGALLQQVASYLNDVYDVDCRVIRLLLSYSGLPREETIEVADYSQVRSEAGATRCNVGLSIIRLLKILKKESKKADIIAIAEDVSRTRYLSLYTLTRLIQAYSLDEQTMGILFHEPVRDAQGCLDTLGVPVQEARYTIPRNLEELLASILKPASRDPAKALAEVARRGESPVVESLYRGQVLDRLGVRSDVDPLMVYRFLFGPREAPITAPKEKSVLVGPPTLASFHSNRMEERALSGIGMYEAGEAVKGFMFTYLNVDPTPTCSELEEKAHRISRGLLTARDLAGMVRVRHPVKLEYMVSSQDRLDDIVAHVYTQSISTQFGVPAQLLVVDRRSRITEWDVSALREVLEALGRRIVPYSTFIRDFATRRLYTS